jgi:hypothetical protein
MIFTFVFFFERSMHIPIKIPTESIQDKEIEYFTFSYLHYTTEINISIETLQRYTKYD